MTDAERVADRRARWAARRRRQAAKAKPPERREATSIMERKLRELAAKWAKERP